MLDAFKNWKTTLIGLIGAVIMYLAVTSQTPGGLAAFSWPGLGAAIVTFLAGLVAKDATKTGTTDQPR